MNIIGTESVEEENTLLNLYSMHEERTSMKSASRLALEKEMIPAGKNIEFK